MPEPSEHLPPEVFIVSEEEAGQRLDRFLVGRMSQEAAPLSRAHIKRAIDAAAVRVDDVVRKPSFQVLAEMRVTVAAIKRPRTGPEPEDIPLEVLYEDDDLAVINKPPGMVVHPGRGHWTGTLAAALAFHFDQLSTTAGETRPGIVHRLDRDTSGAIIVAKNDVCHAALSDQFKARTVQKEYIAIVLNEPNLDRDNIVHSIGDHPRYREKKTIREGHSSSRHAETFYEVTERFSGFALVNCRPKTGRTHQIRLHLKSIGCPVLCDKLYGGRAAITKQELKDCITRQKGRLPSPRKDEAEEAPPHLLARQALHAHRLEIAHPTTGKRMEFVADFPEDILAVLDVLRG